MTEPALCRVCGQPLPPRTGGGRRAKSCPGACRKEWLRRAKHEQWLRRKPPPRPPLRDYDWVRIAVERGRAIEDACRLLELGHADRARTLLARVLPAAESPPTSPEET